MPSTDWAPTPPWWSWGARVGRPTTLPGEYAVTKPSAGHYVVTFGGALADTDIAAMTADSASLTGGTHTATIGTETAGAVAETPFGRVVETSAQDRGLPAGRIRVDLDIKSAVTAATF